MRSCPRPPAPSASFTRSSTINAATHEVSLNVEPAGCKTGSQCGKQLADYVLKRVTSPWVHTQGVSSRMYTQQRELVFDWNHCYCATPGAGFTPQPDPSHSRRPPEAL
jgi:hypothetical protein